MAKLLGTYQQTLDAKGRVAVPARLRERVERFVLTALPERCLALYPLTEWKLIEQQLAERAKSSLGWAEARALERELFGNAVDVSLDRQGRMLIPENLRERAGITREVTFVGVRNRIEVWDAETWSGAQRERTKAFARVAQEVLR